MSLSLGCYRKQHSLSVFLALPSTTNIKLSQQTQRPNQRTTVAARLEVVSTPNTLSSTPYCDLQERHQEARHHTCINRISHCNSLVFIRSLLPHHTITRSLAQRTNTHIHDYAVGKEAPVKGAAQGPLAVFSRAQKIETFHRSMLMSQGSLSGPLINSKLTRPRS